MPLPGRMFAGDEELGKKNDDHRPSNGVIPVPSWPIWKTIAPRLRRRRVVLGLIACLVIYVFISNIPTDLGPVAERYDIRMPNPPSNRGSRALREAPTGQPPHPAGLSEVEKHYYDGQIKFYWLAASLHGIARTLGYREVNKNVLFAAGNLQSASRMIPMACEMSRWNRNFVHFVFIGRDDLPMSTIQELNGAGADCDIYWHDARPDYSPWSSDFRMEVGVNAALGHIQSFMHPQAFITDDLNHEEAFFVKGIRSKALEIGKSIIELPLDAANKLRWMTRLDSGSLSAWHRTYVDILIQAPSGSSGSLLRLLRSIERADYFSARRPHLTIELPAKVDPPTKQHLEHLVWPPLDPSGTPHVSQVTLRHRISPQKTGAEEASSHFVQSFYPARPKDSHVLLLSPQVELSPLYYHYLLYNLLEYKYSSYRARNLEDDLMGLSLELPSTHLNDSSPFTPPSSNTPPYEEATTFLWQAPNSNAALYFGEKWMELHSFLASRISSQRIPSPADHQPATRTKHISEKYPAWTEYLLELIRARGYHLLYPNFSSSDAIATVHNELYQSPEEFSHPSPPTADPRASPPLTPNEAFTANPATHTQSPSTNHEPLLLTTSLLSLLPQNGDLPSLDEIPLLAYSGEVLTPLTSFKKARSFAEEFRREIGGCTERAASRTPVVKPMSADDLFCLHDDYNDDENGDANEKENEAVTTPQKGAGGINGVVDIPMGKDHGDTNPEKAATKTEFEAHLARQGGGDSPPLGSPLN